MGVAFLLGLSFVFGVLGNLLSKWKSRLLKTDTLLRYGLYLSLNGLVGTVFFWISGGFSLATDGATLLFGALGALGVAVILVCNILLFRIASVAGLHVLQSAGSLIGAAIYGSLLFDEVIDGWRLLRIGLMLLAAVCIFLDSGGRIGRKKERGAPADRSRKRALMVILLTVHTLASVGYSISLRYYMRMTENADSNSLFCFTNVFLMAGAVLVFAVMAGRRPHEVRPSMDTLRPVMLLLIAGATILSNVGSLISAELVLLLDATVLTPVTSAITILAAFATSILVLREPCGRYSILAALLSLATVLLP